MKSKAQIRTDLEESILEANTLLKKYKAVKEKYETKKDDVTKRINQYMNELGIDFYDFENSTLQALFSCKKVEPKKIVYDAEKLYNKLGKERSCNVIQKSYRINDIKAFIRLMKRYGVNKQEFKRLVQVDKTVDCEALNNLYETGVVTIEDLDGCYEVVNSKTYFAIKEKEL